MAQNFAYKARSPAGRLVTGRIEAENRKKAIDLLRKRKFFVVELKEAPDTASGIRLDNLLRKKVSYRDLSVMCRQFATMVHAGVPLMQIISIIGQQCDNRILRETMKKVGEHLAGGKSLTESLRPYPTVFPVIFTSMIEAGEVSGNLEQVLDRLAVTFEKDHIMKEKVKSAMTYPVVVLAVAVFAVITLLILVLPNMTKMLVDLDVPLPLSTRIILGLSDLLQDYWYIAMILLAVVVTGLKAGVRTGKGKEIVDTVTLKLPVIGQVIQKIIISRFCRSLGTLLQSGVPVLQALEIVRNIVNNHPVNMLLKDAERSIKEGRGIAPPLKRSRLFPPMVSTMVAIGEETGSVDTLMEKVAGFYEDEVENLMARLPSLIEPLLLVVMGVVVAFILLAIMQPVFSIYDNIK